MVENERRLTANRECSRQYGIARKVQSRFDFSGQFIAQVKKPTTEKWQLVIAAGLAFSEIVSGVFLGYLSSFEFILKNHQIQRDKI